MEKINNTKERQIPPQKKGLKDFVNEILVLCREGFTTLKHVEELSKDKLSSDELSRGDRNQVSVNGNRFGGAMV